MSIVNYVHATMILSAILGSAVLVAAWMLLRRLRRPSREAAPQAEALAMLQSQINASSTETTRQVEALSQSLRTAVDALSSRVSQSMGETNRTMGDRLDNAARVMGDVRQQLGKLEQSSVRIVELGQDISKLQDILQPPKLRGRWANSSSPTSWPRSCRGNTIRSSTASPGARRWMLSWFFAPDWSL